MDYRIDQLRQQLREDPSSRQFYQLGELLRRDEALDESVSVLRAGLGHHPRYVAAWVALGRALLAKGELVPAEEAFWHALELDPENAVAARGAGEAAIGREDWLAAIRSLKLARVLSPGDPVVAEKIALVEQRLAERGELEGKPARRPAEPAVAPPVEAAPTSEAAVEPEPGPSEGEPIFESAVVAPPTVDVTAEPLAPMPLAAEALPEAAAVSEDPEFLSSVPGVTEEPVLLAAGPTEQPATPEPLPEVVPEPALEAVFESAPEVTEEPELPLTGPAVESAEPEGWAPDTVEPPEQPAEFAPALEPVSEPERLAAVEPALPEVGLDTLPAVSQPLEEPMAHEGEPFALEPPPAPVALAESDPFADAPAGEAGEWVTGDDVFGGEAEPPAETWPAAETLEPPPPAETAPVEVESALHELPSAPPVEPVAELPLPTLTLARLALAQGDRELAERTLESLLERGADSAEARRLLAQLKGEVEPGAVSAAELAQKKVAALQGWLHGVRLAAGRDA